MHQEVVEVHGLLSEVEVGVVGVVQVRPQRGHARRIDDHTVVLREVDFRRIWVTEQGSFVQPGETTVQVKNDDCRWDKSLDIFDLIHDDVRFFVGQYRDDQTQANTPLPIQRRAGEICPPELVWRANESYQVPQVLS